MTPRFVKPLVWSIVGASVCYFAAIAIAGTDNIFEYFSRVPAYGLPIILSLSVLNYLIRFFRWHWFVSHLGHTVPMGWHLMYYFAGLGLTTTPAKAGETIRSVYLKNHGIGYTRSIGGLFAERAADVVAIGIIACLAPSQFNDYLSWVAAVFVIAVIVIVVLRLPWLKNRLDNPGQDSAVPVARRIAGHIGETVRAATDLFAARIIVSGVVIGLAAWGAQAYSFYLITFYLDLDIGPLLAMSIFSLSLLIGALSFVPGGLGSAEAVMGGLLIAAGSEPALAVAATVLCRITSLWFAVALGLGAITTLQWTSRGLFLSESTKSST